MEVYIFELMHRGENMNYLIVKDGTISNIIVCENDDIAHMFNAVKSYEGANIGDVYAPKPEITQLDRIEAQVTYTAMMTDTLLEE